MPQLLKLLKKLMESDNSIASITRQLARFSGLLSHMYGKIRKPAVDVPSENAERFRNLVEIADEIGSEQPEALFSLIKLILRPLQAEQMLSVAEHKQHGALGNVDLYHLFSNDAFFSVFDQSDCRRSLGNGERVDLAKDLVLPTPWVRSRFVAALTSIGVGRAWGAWQQDPNHSVELVLPWRLALVSGGNHSITAGILAQEGTLEVSSVLDLTPLLSRVYCNGDFFICRQSKERIARVKNGRVGAVFEIGRLLLVR